MKRFFVLLSLVVFFGCASKTGSKIVDGFFPKSEIVGSPIVATAEDISSAPSYLKAVIANNSKFWVVVMGLNRGRYVLRPFTSETFSFTRKGEGRYIAHAWHQSYTDDKGNLRFKDFAGEISFSILLGNEEKSYYGDKVGDIITFSNSSFSFSPRYPYPRRYLHGPHPWQNFSAQEFFMDYP